MIIKDNKKAKMFYGNCRPVRVMKNNKLLGGWKKTGMSSGEAEFNHTFNDVITLHGRGANIPGESKSGEIVFADNVYEKEHSVECFLTNPNLAPNLEEKTEGSVALSYNEDGTFNVTIVNEDGYEPCIDYSEILTLSAGTYNFEAKGAVIGLYGSRFNDDEVFYGGTFTIEEETIFGIVIFSIGENCSISLTEDLSSQKVSRYGKNLLDISNIIGTTVTVNGGTLTCGVDGGITGSGTPTSGCSFFGLPNLYLSSGTYTLSRSGIFTNMTCVVYIRNAEGKVLATFGVNDMINGVTNTCNLADYPTYSYLSFEIKRSDNNIEMSGTAYFQLEKGDTATPYELYKEPQTVTANADGTVDGLTSLSPNMTIMTETEGAVINAHYLKSLSTDSLPPAPDNIRPVIGAQGKITVTDREGNANETQCPELYGVQVAKDAPYNYTETVNGEKKYYITDTLEGKTITRRIGKLELTGVEDGWGAYINGSERVFALPYNTALKSSLVKCICNAFIGLTRSEIYIGAMGISCSDGYIRVSQEIDGVFLRDIEVFKAFLAEQYAKGTPVTIYYALAEPVIENIESYPRSLPFYTYIKAETQKGYLNYGMQDCIKVSN
jgi:hypothetical protein